MLTLIPKMRSHYDDGSVLKPLDVLNMFLVGLQLGEINDDNGHLFMESLVLVWLELIYFLGYLWMSLHYFCDVLKTRLVGLHFLISNTVGIFNITRFISYRSGRRLRRPKIYIALQRIIGKGEGRPGKEGREMAGRRDAWDEEQEEGMKNWVSEGRERNMLNQVVERGDMSINVPFYAQQLGITTILSSFPHQMLQFYEISSETNHPKSIIFQSDPIILLQNCANSSLFLSSCLAARSIALNNIIITNMQQKQVLQLIETIVKPLREKLQHLEKENEKLKTQINLQQRTSHQPIRRRSVSKDERGTPKKGEPKEVLSPSSKKKEEKGEKPVWAYGKPAKPEPNQMKSPPPKDKNIQTPNSKVRALSKDKQSDKKVENKQVDKRIVGGKKADPETSPKQLSKHQSPQTQPAAKEEQSLV